MDGYRLAQIGVVRLEDGATITRDMAEWDAYRDWLRAGNVPEPMELATLPRWPDLATAQAEIWEAAKRRRDELERGGFMYLGKRLDSDQVAVSRIGIATQAAQAAALLRQPFAVGWTCADGTVVELDAAGMMGMPAALAMHANALHQAGRAFKARIFEAVAIDEIEAIEVEVAAWGRTLPEPALDDGGMP
jgi:hypothetical protein